MKVIVSEPENLAITLSEVKGQLRIETDFTEQDDLLTGYIKAATGYIENVCGRKLITQTWRFETWPDIVRPVMAILPFGKAQSVTSVSWKNETGITEAIDEGEYELVHVNDDESWIRFKQDFRFSDGGYHTNPLSITFVTGYGGAAEDVPAEINLALKLLVAHYHTNGLPTLNEDVERAVFSLLDNHRVRRMP